MNSTLVALLQRLHGWRLWVNCSLAVVLATELIVAAMDLLLNGAVTADYLLTGMVAAGIVAPASLFVLSPLLGELSRRQQEELSHNVESAEARLKVALDSSDEGVLMVAGDGRVLSANKRFFKLWHVPPELAAAGQDELLLAHVLNQLVDPEGFLAGVKRLYGSDAEASDRLRFKDGRVYERYTRALSLGGEQGRIWCFRDVSEQAHTLEALAEREEIYRAIVTQANDAITLIDTETFRFVEFNDAACEGLGYTRDEFARMGIADIEANLDAETIRQRVPQIVEAGMRNFETRHRHKDGSLRDVLVSLKGIELLGHARMVATWSDITERKRSEAASKEGEELYRAIVDQAGEGIDLVDLETLRFVEVNDAACRMLGYRREELVQQSLVTIQADLDEAGLREAVAGIRRSGHGSFEARHRCKDGRALDVQLSVRIICLHGRDFLVGVWRDVTERKITERAMQELNADLDATLRAIPDLLFEMSDEGEYKRIWARNPELLAAQEQVLLGRTVKEVLPPEAANAVMSALREAENSGYSHGQVIRLPLPRGDSWFELSTSVKASSDPSRKRFIMLSRDITERKQMDEALRISEANYRELVSNANAIILRMGLDGTVTFFNEFAERFFGYSSAEILGRHVVGTIVPRRDSESGLDLAEMISAILADPDKFAENENENLTRDGRRVFVRWANRVMLDQQNRPTGVLAIGQDITGRKEAEWNLKMAVEVTQVIFWKVDLLSQELVFDQASLPMLGLEADQQLNTLQAWLEHVHPDEAGQFMERFQAAMQPGDPVFDMEYRLRRLDGEYQWVHTKGSVIQRGADGRPELAVGTSMNITARKNAEVELARHRQHLEELVQQRTTELLATEARASQILASTADGLYGVDSESRITFINPAACRMFGYTAEQVIGRRAHALFHHSKPDGSPYPAEECAARQAWRAGRESRVDDETYWHADGHPVPVALATHPIVESGEVIGAVVSIVDVGERRAAAQAREQALRAAESLARARSEFLANMSHEIRTPMNGVLGFAHIGQRNCKDPEKARNAFEKILASGNQLLGVVNEILDFSKIEAGKLQINAIEMALADVLNQSLSLVADRARAKGLDLRLEVAPDLPLNCVSDPLRIGQVLLNLLSNAVKFTETGSIVLSASRHGADMVFRVTDSGIGISPEQLGYIFDPFQQADGSTTRKFGGTGLGLAISKRIVELMGGDIAVDSTSGIGSTFEFRLPYAPATESGARPASAPDPVAQGAQPGKPLAGITILVAEDDVINQMVLEVNLVEDGARLVMVGNGLEAVERIISDGPVAYDLVLMDIQMPVMDGYEATRRILELAPGLPIVGQTAHAFAEDRDKCLAAGMADHIAKPIDPQALVTLVLRIVAAKRNK